MGITEHQRGTVQTLAHEEDALTAGHIFVLRAEAPVLLGQGDDGELPVVVQVAVRPDERHAGLAFVEELQRSAEVLVEDGQRGVAAHRRVRPEEGALSARQSIAPLRAVEGQRGPPLDGANVVEAAPCRLSGVHLHRPEGLVVAHANEAK